MTQSTATNNGNRTHVKMTDNELKAGYRKLGYQFKGHCTCGPCEDELLRASQSEGYTGTTPAWGNPRCALKFHKKGSTVVACKCGWRKNITNKFTPKESIKCKVRGCRNTLLKTDTDGLCVLCRKEIAGGGNPATYAADCSYEQRASGCSFYVQEGRAGCIRTKCKSYTGVIAPPVKTCNRKGCNNPVPHGRKAVCYTCLPKPQSVVM